MLSVIIISRVLSVIIISRLGHHHCLICNIMLYIYYTYETGLQTHASGHFLLFKIFITAFCERAIYKAIYIKCYIKIYKELYIKIYMYKELYIKLYI